MLRNVDLPWVALASRVFAKTSLPTVKILALVVALSVLPCSAFAAPPNVVLIIVETLTADHLGTYGFPHDTSPRIDALAVESVVFERAVAASSRTAPSHGSITTSRYPREHSVGYEDATTALGGLPTLAQNFRSAGYATGAFIGNMLLHSRLGLNQGFDVYDDDLSVQEKNRSSSFERYAEQTAPRPQ